MRNKMFCAVLVISISSTSAQVVTAPNATTPPPELNETQGMPRTGPANKDLTKYLTGTPGDCTTPEEKHCTLASEISHMTTFYGSFPGDTADYVIAFLSLRTGGSGELMTAVVMKRMLPKDHYALVGRVDVYGENPRQLEFGPDRTITWVGTVAQPGEPHCCPTGAQYFRISVKNNLQFSTVQ